MTGIERHLTWNEMTKGERVDLRNRVLILFPLLSGVMFLRQPFSGICLVVAVFWFAWLFFLSIWKGEA